MRPDSYIAIDNFYTATVYEKGAEVHVATSLFDPEILSLFPSICPSFHQIIRMYETLLGTENFKKGLALYLQRHDGQVKACATLCSSLPGKTLWLFYHAMLTFRRLPVATSVER